MFTQLRAGNDSTRQLVRDFCERLRVESVDDAAATIALLEAALDRLEQTERMLTGRALEVARAAHEINNALSVIRTYASLNLEGLAPTEPLHEDLVAIVEAAKRAAVSTDGLLAFGHQVAVDGDGRAEGRRG